MSSYYTSEKIEKSVAFTNQLMAHAIDKVNDMFNNKDFAKQNPELVAAFMYSSSLIYQSQMQAECIEQLKETLSNKETID